jgi:two-component system, chemotaxis family, protein-glutamate methylesterase/glutaminase
MTVRVLIVDDSPTMRGLIAAALRRDAEIVVVGSACDPIEARKMIKELNPDVLTLDVEMPNMSGLEFLEKLMRLRPMPVVMVSTLTHAGTDASIAALEIGAVDCIGKPVANMQGDGFGDLAARVKAAAQARVRQPEAIVVTEPRTGFRPNGRIVGIGSSTGGVEALLTILSRFPADCPPTVITQHMPANFTKSFAERLNKFCAPNVVEATDGAPIVPGTIYIAPGGTHHLRVAGETRPRCALVEGPLESGHRPSVDILFHSIARVVGPAAVGVILTGMGRDGAEGLLAMRRAGASTIGQDEATCIVYGMPRSAHQIGAVERQLPLRRIADAILDSTDLQTRKAS